LGINRFGKYSELGYNSFVNDQAREVRTDMKVTSERLDNCQVKVFVELDAAEVDKRLRQTARKISRQFNVPGYRRGRAPFHAVVRVFGREAIQQEALEEFGNELYEKALDEIEYEPYEAGELEDVEWDPFRMTVMLPIQPEVDLGDYRAVRVPFEVEEVTEERIEEYLAGVQQEHAQWVPVERPAALGDQVMLDMEGKAGEQLIMSNEGHEMILEEGGAYPMQGFHEEIVGMSAGEEKTFVLTVPEDDSEEEVAGQEATITVWLHTVREQEVPPLDDELALMVGDYDSLDDLRSGVREQLETEALQKTESEYLDNALDGFIEAAIKIEYPEQAIDREAELSLNQMERNLASSGLQLDTYLGMIGKTREAYKREMRPAAEERLQKRLVLGEIVEQEGLAIEPEEVEAELERMGEAMGPQAEQMLEMLSTPEGRLVLANDLVTAKAQERAIEIAKGEAPPLEAEEEEEIEVEAAAETAEEEAKVGVGAEVQEEAEAEDVAEAPIEGEAEAAESDSDGSDTGNS
jgi:trigger factor